MSVDLYQVILGGIAVAIMVLVPILCVVVYDLLAGRWDGAPPVARAAFLSGRPSARRT